MLSSTEITKLIASPPSGLTAGALAHLARREHGQSTVKQSAFLKDMQQQRPVGTAPTAQAYEHPGRLAYHSKPRPDGPLTPTELAWLQRLPADAALTPYDDAAALGQLAANISRSDHPTDHRLVHSYWQPVADHHDRNEANVTLANARATPLPTPPSSTLPALAEVVTVEHPELSPGEATGRAKVMIDQAVAKRSDARAQAIADAQDTLAALDDATPTRSAVTR